MDEQTNQNVSTKLLNYLNQELDTSSIRYTLIPEPIGEGQVSNLFKFQLNNAPDYLSHPLILRIFPQSMRKGHAAKEGLVQNALKKEGYPVAKTHFICDDDSIFGGEFIVMDYISGEPLWKIPNIDTPKILAKLHAKLHNIDPTPVMETLGNPPDDFYLYSVISLLEHGIHQGNYERLKPGLQWLLDNRPYKTEKLVMCHGDFHPINILWDKSAVSAVLDWGTFRFEEPAYDVACTKTVLSVLGPIYYPNIKWDTFVKRYYEFYQKGNRLDQSRVDFFDTVRLLKALHELDYGLKVWSRTSIEKKLIDQFEEKTGVKMLPTLY